MMKIIGQKEILGIVPVSRMTLWNWEQKGQFPKRIKLSAGRVGWLETEVHQWIKERAAKRQGVA